MENSEIREIGDIRDIGVYPGAFLLYPVPLY